MRSRWDVVYSVLISILLRTCNADISFSSPAAGQIISGSTIDVEFADGAGKPSINDFTAYTLQLCAGGNTDADFTILLTFTDKGTFSSSSYSAQITNLNLGGNTANAYFLRTIGVAPGGVVYNFSPRFTLSAMTGVFPANVQTALTKVTGTSGPPTVNQIANPPAAGGAAPAAGAGAFGVAYTLQTGPVRYAPMAKPAPSKITAKGNARQFPTSGYSVWSRNGMPGPDATQTVTNPYTYATISTEPTIMAATQPSDMQLFLNRWKD